MWIIIIPIVVVLIFFLIKSGNDKFWKCVNKHPTEAYDFFTSNDCWFVIHPNESKTKPNKGNWSGPFFVPIPGIGRLKIYGKENEFEIKQQEFISEMENK